MHFSTPFSFVLAAAVCFVLSGQALQAQTVAADVVTPNSSDVFTYDGKNMPHYAIKWAADSWDNTGNTAWVSSYSGIKFFTGGAIRLAIPHSGNMGLGTTIPSAYFHGGNNKALEIFNSNTDANSQSHLVLSTGATVNTGSVGTITFVTANSSGNKGVAYIGGQIPSDASVQASGVLVFATANAATPLERMRIDPFGNVSIGATDSKGYKLAVNGAAVFTKAVVKNQAGWPDYVFDSAYQLPSLDSIQQYIQQNKHLPECHLRIACMQQALTLQPTRPHC